MAVETVQILEVATGEKVEFAQEIEESYVDNQRFLYEEGNFSCDCNRKLMFGRAKGVEFSLLEIPCGETGYKVRVAVNGEVVLDELEKSE